MASINVGSKDSILEKIGYHIFSLKWEAVLMSDEWVAEAQTCLSDDHLVLLGHGSLNLFSSDTTIHCLDW